jgi:hypothetical protein
MSGLFEMLQKIHKKPGMYIGRASATDLFMFIVGYRTAREELGVEPTEKEMEFYGDFQPWLQKRYEVSTSGSWARIIEFYTNNEERSFHRFYELLDEFLQRDRHSEVEQVQEKVGNVKTGESILK